MASKTIRMIAEFIKFFTIVVPYLSFYLIYCYFHTFWKLITPTKLKSLEGETILITGCATGIGKAVAIKLSQQYKEKLRLILWDNNEDSLKNTTNEVKILGTTAYSYVVDVSNPTLVSEVAQKIREEIGNVTIIINNAGISYNRAFLKLTPEQIQRTLRINCLAHFWTIKEFLPKMIENNHGHIVATCSMGGLMAIRGNVPYFSSKFAIRGIMMALKEEMRSIHPDKTDIQFTTLYPWFVKTPLLDYLDFRVRFPNICPLVDPEYIAEQMIKGIRKNTEHVLAPSTYGLYLWLESIFPEPLTKKIRDYAILEYRGTIDDLNKSNDPLR